MEGGGWQGGNSQEMKAAGWEAAGDPHPAQTAPLLWSGGPQGLCLAFIPSSMQRRFLPMSQSFSLKPNFWLLEGERFELKRPEQRW